MKTRRYSPRRSRPGVESLDGRDLPSAGAGGFFGALAAERAALFAQRQEMMTLRQQMFAQRQAAFAAQRASFSALRTGLARPLAAPFFQGQTPIFVGNMPVNPFPTPGGFFSITTTPSGPAGARALFIPPTTSTNNVMGVGPVFVANNVPAAASTTAGATNTGVGAASTGPFQGQTPIFVGSMPVNPFPTPSGYYSIINTSSGPAGAR